LSLPAARIPALAAEGLDLVPGYRLDADGREDPTWRADFFAYYERKRDWRVWAQEKFARDSAFRDDVLLLCSRDSAFFTDLFLTVEEPRSMAYFDAPDQSLDEALAQFAAGHWEIQTDDLSYRTIHPFIMFDYQVQAHRLLTYTILGPMRGFYHDILWDKARGIGMSYAFLAWAYWAWCFIPGLRGTILTEKWDKAERSDDLNSLFGKLDLFLDATPAALIPETFKDKGEKQANRAKGRLTHPTSGAAIFTEPTTADSTRGGREAYVGVDEINFHEYLDETWATVGGTTKHRVGWSSASHRYGRQGERKFKNGREHPKSATVVTLEWYQNPHQDAAWYEAERDRFRAAGQEEQFEVEYLRNASAGSGRLVYIAQVNLTTTTEEWYDPTKPLKLSVDPGTEDATAVCFWQTHFKDGTKRIRVLDSIQMEKIPVQAWAHILTGIEPVGAHVDSAGIAQPPDDAYAYWLEGYFEQGNVRHIMDWMREVSPHSIQLYGDPAMLRRDVTHDSWISVFETLTLKLRRRAFGETSPNAIPMYANFPSVKPLYKRQSFQDRRIGAREALQMTEWSSTEGALLVREALENTRFQELTERTTRPPGHIHDQYSHRATSYEWGMIWETLKLTPDELKPQRLGKIEQPKGLRRAGGRTRSKYQRTKTETLVGVG
jgi:hypothetical protein